MEESPPPQHPGEGLAEKHGKQSVLLRIVGRHLLYWLPLIFLSSLVWSADYPTRSFNFQRTGVVQDSGLLPPLVIKWSMDTSSIVGKVENIRHVTPVVKDGTVYLTHRYTGHLLAFNALDGAFKWSRFVWPVPACIGEFYQPTAGLDGLYLTRAETFGCSTVYQTGTFKVDFQGNIVWNSEQGERQAGSYSPLVVNDRVYVLWADGDQLPERSIVRAYDAATGATVWTYTLTGIAGVGNNWGPQSPAWDGDTIYVVGSRVAAIQDGGTKAILKWEYDYGASPLLGPGMPSVANNKVYFTYGNTLYALDKQSGAQKWSFVHEGGKIAAYIQSVVDQVVLLETPRASGAPSGTLYAVEDLGSSASLKWQQPINVTTGSSGGGIMTVVNNILYFQEGVAVVGRDVETGNVVWSGVPVGDPAQPVVGEGLMFDYATPDIRCWGRPVSVHLNVDKATASLGDNVIYNLSVNTYGGPTTTITLVETLPANVNFVSATGGGMLLGNLVVWNGLAVTADAILTVTLTGQVNPSLAPGTYDLATQAFLDYAGAPAALTESLSDRVHTVVVVPPPTPPSPPTNLSLVRVFPNPFNPARAARGTVKFEGLPIGTEVRIYTPRGLKVWEGEVVTPYLVEWNGRSEDGKPVAPGTYLWIAEGDGVKERGTLIVE